jgi:hypothetical protein
MMVVVISAIVIMVMVVSVVVVVMTCHTPIVTVMMAMTWFAIPVATFPVTLKQ